MPAFLTHFWILNRAIQRCRDATVRSAVTGVEPTHLPPGGQSERISQLAYLGSMGPDIAAYDQDKLSKKHPDLAKKQTVFDLIHRKKSSAIVMNMLDAARKLGGSDREALLSFTFGFLAHIAGDIIVHPYVNNFAGEYHEQPIPVVFNAFQPKKVAMHMHSELHMDCYVAMSHYACGDQLSNGPGDETLRSWSDFFDDLLTEGVAGALHDPKPPLTAVFQELVKAVQKAYPGMGVDLDGYENALGRMFDVLDVAYDMASMHDQRTDDDKLNWFPPVDWWFIDYIEHVHYRDTWRRFEDFCDAAARVAAEKFWPAAVTYLNSGGKTDDRKKFLKEVRDWNLDTGYAIRLYQKEGVLHIRYDHSWAVFLKEKALPRDIKTMNDDLMRVCLLAAKNTNDYEQTPPGPQDLPHEGNTFREYLHKDMDYGMARVRCESGNITVSATGQVRSTWEEIGQIDLGPKDDKILELKNLHQIEDQHNRVVVSSPGAARYVIDFISWDR